ncbi:uncharacterized protein C6orf136 homolog [Melanotaenia boesemani]|uniref:uncharacterized protein C6orf136 homolog n=1 Tax=Melanotaenia boesemani TaxID=1250792 RepID=UPI001C03F151|nr:uncharacterized protein C6orf136 homolog [Melanotaenia boesemani]XP_041868213.1 uncharacterized protein C6orf136 homolog [Melanotaenia boesemani]XP_041868214.1 uncharacterized protein C6orf136 homolog [Melanotaenia boesemani]
MAVCRGGMALWVGCVCSHSRRQPIQKLNLSLSQVSEWQWMNPTRSLGGAAWALAPPNSLRYQNIRQPLLSHPLHHASQPQRHGCDEDWEESLSVCLLVPHSESHDLHSLLELPSLSHVKPRELLVQRSLEFCFPLTTVDGSREDDISVESPQRSRGDAVEKEHGCFRSLFEAEGCPAPFMYGSTFYCFHCPETHLVSCSDGKSNQDCGLNRWPGDLLPSVDLCSSAGGAEVENYDGDWEREEKLSMMYERLRIELPGFFLTNHDYTMYSNDVEFINGLVNMKTRGRVAYRLTLSMWRLLCLCYYAEARLDVLKLTKHMEDGTIKARWRVRGLPLHTVLLRFYRKDKSHLYRSYDAFSTFYVGQDGLIHCHKVEKVIPARPPVLPGVTSLLTGVLVALGVQEPRPALNLLPLFLSSLRQSRN